MNNNTRKKLGIIGGMGSRAGANFLQKVIDLCPARTDQEFVEIFMHSNPNVPDRTRAIVHGEACPLEEILRSVKVMNNNNVDFIVLTCNTSYYYYQNFIPYSKAEVLHPVQILKKYVLENGFKKIGLLATTGTIRSGIFCRELGSLDCEVVKLSPEEQENIFMASVYMEHGLKSSVVNVRAVDLMYTAARILIDKGVQLLVGGCSEVSIALDQRNVEVPYVDTMDLVAREVVERCYYGRDDKTVLAEAGLGASDKIIHMDEVSLNKPA
ncbi:aspartate/glutamate racemase family protein [Sinomicrobium weinanense]|uniref:Amino acid racemase n=1 Tax=Sinomicrobium weinanense TaxID=2842200 RepID=A0A926JPU6_9FLAO|nr:amino acid racemase [Sinomicrobium weinanense]MBC9795255.1 amino acid racemase [Sinomicrobium weinanense]MBU3125727.1 amino acid racemase [Sinomicrobium weinanense]